MYQQAIELHYQSKNKEAQPLFEQALEIRRRLLTDENPESAEIYDTLALNLRPMPIEDIRRAAEQYKNLAIDLDAPGSCARFQPLFEKALSNPNTAAHRRTPGYRRELRPRCYESRRPGKAQGGSAAARTGAGDSEQTFP